MGPRPGGFGGQAQRTCPALDPSVRPPALPAPLRWNTSRGDAVVDELTSHRDERAVLRHRRYLDLRLNRPVLDAVDNLS